MKKLIIIPTFNEKNNITKLVDSINAQAIDDLAILVVDDNSPDGTAQAVLEKISTTKNLHLIRRSGKLGLGTAYITGFKWGLAKNYDVVLEMDADFSHDPKYLKQIFQQLMDHDFVIGSRYVAGGGINNFSFFRRLISRGGSLYSKIILGVKINDFTGGFNGWQTKIFKTIDLDSIKSNGYSFQVEMKYRAARAGFSFVEVPIIFQERRGGVSKMSKKIFIEAIIMVLLFRFKR